MKLESSLQVFNQSAVPTAPGVIEGITLRKLTGTAEHPSERINVALAILAAGTHEHLHFHLIETFHYVVAGRAIVRDIAGKSYEVGPGDVVYGPPGMRGAHEWEIRETLHLLTVKGTNDPERAIQFSIDQATGQCTAEIGYLIGRGAGDMKESFY
jgi:mannose-6-phosphate isomerase-like protein (cupin superfamily)